MNRTSFTTAFAVLCFTFGATDAWSQRYQYAGPELQSAPASRDWQSDRQSAFSPTIDRSTWPVRPISFDEVPTPPEPADDVVVIEPLDENDTLLEPVELNLDGETGAYSEGFEQDFTDDPPAVRVGTDFYAAPDFKNGILVFGQDVALKIGGYVKADFIQDFEPIDNTDSFDTTTIPVGAPDRTNARFHARQSRLSFDTRWASGGEVIRIFIESDFFSEGNRFRLRHAYGEMGSLLVGQTWTTFTDVAAAPATLDFEGSVSSVNRRQAQARWTTQILDDGLTVALAIEETQFIIEAPAGFTITPRSPSPDFVGHLRWQREWGRFQIAGLYRVVGAQLPTSPVYTENAWGLNFTGVIFLPHSTKAYYQVVFGEAIGSYRSLPDAAPTSATSVGMLPLFGWMFGVTHNWSDSLSSNFTYAENSLNNTVAQPGTDVHRTTYLAANLMWNPKERVTVGVEYLYGLRENVDGGIGVANRVQFAFIFDLP